jgi:cytochrome c oxidase subunit 3
MLKNKVKFQNNQNHGFHLVDPSPWPILTSFSVLMLTLGTVLYMHGYAGGLFLSKFGLFMVVLMSALWWRDVVREGTFEGQHTIIVQQGLRIGMFIISELCFAFFWAFFHSSFNPSISIGGVWPPAFITILDPWKIPLLNTVLLLSSGASVTWAHNSIVWGSKFEASVALLTTIILAVIFTGLQAFEYITAPFTISDSVYGATFYMATGFHGFHVIVGTIFLTVCFFRLYLNHFTREHHFGFEAAAWYWHFVDVVWLFLFISIYWWGS